MWGRIEWYATALVIATGLLALGTMGAGGAPSGSAWGIAALSCVALIAERQSVQIGSHTQTSVSALPIVFAAVVYGPLAAMIVAAASLLFDFRSPYTRWVIWTTSRCVVAGLTGLTAGAVMSEGDSFAYLMVAAGLALLAEGMADVFFTSFTVALRHKGSFTETARPLARLVAATLPLYAPVIAVLVFAYTELTPWTVLLFVAPALAAQRLLFLYQEQRRLTNDVLDANDRLEQATLSFAAALVAALDARDSYTAGHSAAVAVYARDIAQRMGLPVEEQQRAHLCGLLHDIGKVGLPPTILEKTGPLTLVERRQMEEHATIGERILANVEEYSEIAMIVRHHHERVDGNGYPDGLAGDDIPLVSRIIAVADAYNAMTSGRPYREAMPSRVARLRLAQAAATQFDTAVVAAFEAMLAGASTTYLSGARADFAVEAQRHPVLLLRTADAVA
jgi:putative nucleotidyltransferase with HDIG domain